MPHDILVSLSGERELLNRLKESFFRVRPRVIGLASAFVSVWGVEQTAKILRQNGNPRCRLVAGTSYYITHPKALSLAQQCGWELRLGRGVNGIFHPKLFVAGTRFQANGAIEQVSFVYVGSANLTERGLTKNTECGLIAEAHADLQTASDSFAFLWNSSEAASDVALRNYAATFAELSRRRSTSQLEELGVSDQSLAQRPEIRELGRTKPPKLSAVDNDFAEAAWAGLQSSTGEFRFQIEFPRAAGEVIRRLLAGRTTAAGRVDVLCAGDNQTRKMQFRYYANNSMYRLNVPNDVPDVDWVHQHKDGIALIQSGPTGGAPIRLTIHRPGVEANEIIGRSVALGTWGRTRTRLYGWF